MAAVILPLAPPLATQYALPEADRLAILAQPPSHPQQSAVTTAEIERQRRAFIAMHGCQFGTLQRSDTPSPKGAGTEVEEFWKKLTRAFES